ncbi:MAG TPA: FG-GAP-like repeat-containing protein, partial [Pseudomonadota bacterium]|nr:FG-GAP-like repeat-containing protein [Pseudomonadota bacterium]
MTRRAKGAAKWLTVGILAASACGLPQAGQDEDLVTEEEIRTAQTARPPTLSKVEPATVITGNEVELTITGKGFVPGARVMVGGLLAAPPRTVTATKIQVSLPPGLPASATAPVRVILPDGRQGERSDLLVIAPDPIALSLAPPRQRYSAAGSRAPVVADFNLDGRPDVASVSSTGTGIVLHLSNPAGGTLTPFPGALLPGAYTLTTADLNRDGKPD